MTEQPLPDIPPHGPVVVRAPQEGWSWQAYSGAVRSFTRARGRAPRKITMHPRTLETLSQSQHQGEGQSTKRALHALTADERRLSTLRHEEDVLEGRIECALSVVTSHDHDLDTLVMS